MNPIEFPGHNVVFAKDQPEYLPLPAYKNQEGTIVTEWELSIAERNAIMSGANIRISIMTFNKPLQPFRPYIDGITQ